VPLELAELLRLEREPDGALAGVLLARPLRSFGVAAEPVHRRRVGRRGGRRRGISPARRSASGGPSAAARVAAAAAGRLVLGERVAGQGARPRTRRAETARDPRRV